MIKFGRPVPTDVGVRLPRLVEALAQTGQIEAIWLFGSRARNEADARSDVDIAVLARSDLDGGGALDWATRVDERRRPSAGHR